MEPLNQHVHRTVTSHLLVCQELESADKILTHTLRRSMGPENLRRAAVRAVLRTQDAVRVPPVVLTTARRSPPTALLLLLLFGIFKRIMLTMRTHVTQCGPTLSFGWHNDPSQEVRAPLQDLLHNALPHVVFLLHLTVARLQLRIRPRIEPGTF